MSAFGGLILTNKGRNLQTKAETGVQLNFTRIAVGDGDLGGASILDLNALIDEVNSLGISKLKTLTNNRAVIGTVLSNQNITTSFYWKELGVFAQDPDEGEILYCYGNAGANAEYIPAGGGADVVEKVIDIEVIVGNASDVTATIDESLAYVTVPRYESEQGTVVLETTASQVRPAINELNTKANNLTGFTKDGFENYVVGAEVQGGVKRIPYDDPAIEYSGSWLTEYYSAFYGGISKSGSTGDTLTLNFNGTAIYAFVYCDHNNRAIEYSIDNQPSQPLTLPITEPGRGSHFLVKIAEGLVNGQHSLDIEVLDHVGLKLHHFDIIQTTDRTSKNEAGVSYIDSERATISADTQNFTTPNTGRADLLVVGKDGLVSVTEGTDGNSEKAFRVEEDGVISREYAEDIPEWLKGRVKVWNSGITGDLSTGWKQYQNSTTSNKYSLATDITDGTMLVGFIGTGLDILTLESSNQGIFAVSIDGGAEVEYDNYNASINWQIRKSVADSLPFGYHEVKIRVTGTKNSSSTDVHIYIDAFDIHLPATPDLPPDTQTLAKVYPMPAPATMASVPARPTSAEEKGWVRYEEDEVARYVGSGWSNLPKQSTSSGSSYSYSLTSGDYAEFTFIGDSIRWISTVAPGQGIAEISIDGVVQETVDNYNNSSRVAQHVVYENTNLSFGKHTIKIEVTGTKNTSSSDYKIEIDAFEVHRPLYLEDIRNLSPISEQDSYQIEHKSRTGKVLPKSIGGMLDRLEMMDNVVKIENENGTAYLYPDGRAECILKGIANQVPGNSFLIYEFMLPVILSNYENDSYANVAINISVATSSNSQFIQGVVDYNKSDTTKITISIYNSYSALISSVVKPIVIGRWY